MAMENQTKNVKGEKTGTVYANGANPNRYNEYKALYQNTLAQAHSVENAKKIICDFLAKHVVPARGNSIKDCAPMVEKTGRFTLPATTISFVTDVQGNKIVFGKFETKIIQKDFIALDFESFKTTMSSICSAVNLTCSNFRKGTLGTKEFVFDVAFDFEE